MRNENAFHPVRSPAGVFLIQHSDFRIPMDAPRSPDDTPPVASPADRLKLLNRLRRRFELITDDIAVAGTSYQFTRVSDPEKVLDDVIAAEARGTPGGRMPYWAELWESAIAIGEWLHRNTPAPLSALDLGCGMGFAGMVAASIGHRVTLADIEPDSLLFAELNCWPWRDRITPRRLDWSRDRLNETFDLIIGADVLYERAQWDHLEPFWRAHLAPGGSLILGEPGRETGRLFPDWLTPRGWHVKRTEIRVEDRGKTIRLFALTL